MTTGVACPPIILQFTYNNGQLAAGGSILTQVGGVNAATYQDIELTTPLPNAIPLNSRGEVSNASGASCQLFLTPNTVYTFTFFDANGNQFNTATYVNGVQVSITQAAVGAALWPQTASELANGVTPTSFAYPPGNVLRYGADPTNTNSSVTAIKNAIKCNNVVFFPDGTYKIDSTITVDPGSTLIGLKLVGTRKTHAILQLTLSAGVNATIFNFANELFLDIEIKGLGFNTNAAAAGQTALQFSEIRGGSIIYDCQFTGSGQSTALQFNGVSFGAGSYTAECVVEKCYMTNHLVAILLQGIVTDLTIKECILTNASFVAGAVGISVANTVSTVMLERNQIQGYAVGINSGGTYLFQTENYFENNTSDFTWARGSGNAFIGNTSLYDVNPSTGLVYTAPKNNVDGCTVISFAPQTNPFFDNMFLQAGLGYRERYRTFSMGDFTLPAFSAGNFSANNAMTWSVSSGNMTTYEYTVVGHKMTIIWFISGSTIGGTPSTALEIAIPGGFVPSTRTRVPCLCENNGAFVTGAAEVLAAGNAISIYVDVTTTTNWTASAGNAGTFGEITFQVN